MHRGRAEKLTPLVPYLYEDALQRRLAGGVPVGLPLILAGPIVRRVEKNLVSMWVALREPCTVGLSLRKGPVKAGAGEVWLSAADAGVKAAGTTTKRFGARLHVSVVSLKVDTEQAPEKTLLPGEVYSYNLT